MLGIWGIKQPCGSCGSAVKGDDRIIFDSYKCDCCGRVCDSKNALKIKRMGKWLLGADIDMCFDCFSEWYDGCTDSEEIESKVLSKSAA